MDEERRRRLIEDGYVRIENVLDPDMLARTRRIAETCLAQVSREHRDAYRSEGSLIPVGDYPDFAELIAYPPALAALRDLDLDDVRFSSGYVISKPPHSPPLFWHQDWWGWDDPISYTDRVSQIFLFYYLVDTTEENGCLRVLPGSHRRRHALHDLLDAHTEELAQARDTENRAFKPVEGEVAVRVKAGDLVVGDARLLHGSYPNSSDRERTLITLWFHPNFASMPDAIQSRVHTMARRIGVDTDQAASGQPYPEIWPEAPRRTVEALLPVPTHPAPPQPWNRRPVHLT